MGITFSYMHYVDPFYFYAYALPRIVRALFHIIINYFIFKAGKQQEDLDSSRILKNIALINIVISIVPLAYPVISGTPTYLNELNMMTLYYILLGLVTSVPFFITYGILLIIFAKKNAERYNWYVRGAGYSLAVSYGAYTVNLGSYLANILLYFISGMSLSIIILTTILGFIYSYASLIGFILLTVHGFKFKDPNLRNAGIINIIAFITMYLLNILVIGPALRIILSS